MFVFPQTQRNAKRKDSARSAEIWKNETREDVSHIESITIAAKTRPELEFNYDLTVGKEFQYITFSMCCD